MTLAATRPVDRFVTVPEIRDLLGCSLSHAYEIARMVGIRPGPAGAFRSDLDRYIAARQAQPSREGVAG